MENAIERKDIQDDILEDEYDRRWAEKKWNDLKREVGWKERHFPFLKDLKGDPQHLMLMVHILYM